MNVSLHHTVDLQQTIWTVEKLGALSILICALEALFNFRRIRGGELVDWTVTRETSWNYRTKPVSRWLDILLVRPGVVALTALQCAAAASMLLLGPEHKGWAGALDVLLAVLCTLFMVREPFGRDGADQMQIVIFGSLALAHLHPTPLIQRSAVWFIALQVILSYFTAGLSKAWSPVWRSGKALPAIISTRIYGNAKIAHYLDRRPQVSQFICMGTIAFETLFPFVLLAPPVIIVGMLFIGMSFHLSIARIMGLNTFFWVFLATYPAILYCCRLTLSFR